MALRQLVARPRLVELLGARWRQRAVTVVAGPGFGKSVLLAQAMAENALAPRGIDILIECTAADSCSSNFLAHLANAAASSQTSLAGFLGELSDRATSDVCLMIDDVDHVCADERGARLLADLVNTAPTSVHFVLAGRARLRGLAQARAAGSVIEVGEEQLVFSDAEIVALAALHGVDPRGAGSMGGWPAAASLAASCGTRSATEYIVESVIDDLDIGERTCLAVAAAVGRGDVDLLRCAVGASVVEPASLLARLPLVRLTEAGEFDVHELWQTVVADVVADVELRPAMARAIDALVARAEFDRAFGLCAMRQDWSHAAVVVAACCTHGHAPVLPPMLARWLDALPAERHDEPEGLLLRGLMARVTDPFGQTTADLLERAMLAHRAIGCAAGEIAAGVALLVILRSQGRFEAWPAFLARAAELEAAGHVEAAGPAAVGRALLAESVGDDARMIVELSAIPAGSLSRDWQVVATFRLVMGHLVLGDEHEMLAAAAHCTQLAGEARDRHALAMAEWFAGKPRAALTSCEAIAADGHDTQVSAVLFSSFAAVVMAHAGRIDEASRELALVERGSSGTLGILMRGALLSARATIAVARGDDTEARRIIDDGLDGASLADPITWRMAARFLPLAYVLVPSIRAELDARALGPLHRRRLDVARAVVWAQSGGTTSCDAPASVCADAVATTVPLPWAMVLASTLTARGNSQGRKIAEHLFGLYGEPARDALRATTRHPTRRTADGARKLLASVVFAPRRTVRLNVLGPVELLVGGMQSVDAHWGRERVRSLLIYLTVNGRAHREQILDALWPHLDPVAADRNLRVTLTYLHQVLEPDRRSGEAPFFVRQDCSTLTLVGGPHFSFDAGEFDALFERADDADRRGLPSVALELFEEALALWRGPCLREVVYEEWAQSMCTGLTARFVTASVRAAELSLAAGSTGIARTYAARALAADEWCERAHRVLIAAALANGDRSGARHALVHCDAMLASLGIEADPETEALRRQLLGLPGPASRRARSGPFGSQPTTEHEHAIA